MLGPFTTQPSGRHWSSAVAFPVSEVEKSGGKFRTIFNLSYDWERSTNAGIPKEYGYTTYPSFEEVAAAIQEVGLEDSFFCMFDIETAFRNLTIFPGDWIYQLVSWQQTEGGPREWWLDICLPFGVRVGPAIFNAFGEALEFILKQFCVDPESLASLMRLLRYLDDFLVICRGVKRANGILDAMLKLMRDLNIPVKDSKTVRPTELIKFIGFWFDPRKDLVTLDPERWVNLHLTLLDIASRLDSGAVNAHEVRSVAGVLCWSSKVIQYGMLYTRELYGVLSALGMTSAPGAVARRAWIVDVHLIWRIRQDIAWWLELYELYKTEKWARVGRRISQIGPSWPPKSLPPSSWVMYSDMSGTGFGGYVFETGLWTYAPVPDHITLSPEDKTRIYISSGHGECAGILMCLLTFLPIWAERHRDRRLPGDFITVFSDSSSAVGAWAGEKAKEGMLPYLRAFERLCAVYSVNLRLLFVPGSQNTIADMISRQAGSMTAALREIFPLGDDFPQAQISPGRLLF